MTPEFPLLASIAAAEVHVRNARQSWDPSSLAGCFQCSTHLDWAIAEMRTACEIAGTGPVPPGTKARLDRLRADVEILSRLVDAAIAFGRGLAFHSAPGEMIAAEVEG